MAEDDAAQRARDEADGKGRERDSVPMSGSTFGKNSLVEDQRGRRAIEEEVVPLDRGADEAGEHHGADGRRVDGRRR